MAAQKKLKEVLDVMIQQEQETEYAWIGGMIIKKCLNQRIPYTDEEWAKEMEKQKRYKNRELASIIDKVFFEDGALQMPKGKKKGFTPSTAEEWEKEMEKQQQYKDRQLANYIDKVLFKDVA